MKLEPSTKKAIPDDTVRAHTLYSISIIEREKDGDNKIKGTFIQYLDLNATVIPRAITDPLMAKATKTWFEELNKFYVKNHKKL